MLIKGVQGDVDDVPKCPNPIPMAPFPLLLPEGDLLVELLTGASLCNPITAPGPGPPPCLLETAEEDS